MEKKWLYVIAVVVVFVSIGLIIFRQKSKSLNSINKSFGSLSGGKDGGSSSGSSGSGKTTTGTNGANGGGENSGNG